MVLKPACQNLVKMTFRKVSAGHLARCQGEQMSMSEISLELKNLETHRQMGN